MNFFQIYIIYLINIYLYFITYYIINNVTKICKPVLQVIIHDVLSLHNATSYDKIDLHRSSQRGVVVLVCVSETLSRPYFEEAQRL